MLRSVCGVSALLSILLATPVGAQHPVFSDQWTGVPDRVWIGPGYWANRLQDWRVVGERVECVESRAGLPLRTLHALPLRAGEQAGSFRIEVDLGMLGDGAAQPGSFAGIVIGIGGSDIDYRTSAMMHHRPAEDGGLIVAVHADGTVHIYDNEIGGGGGLWGLGGALKEGELVEIEPTERRDRATPGSTAGPLRLSLEVQRSALGSGVLASTSVIGVEHIAPVSSVMLRDVDPRHVEGGVALVSHLGPKGQDAGHWFDNLTASGESVAVHPDRVYGPVLGCLYTIDDHVLKLTAQMGPLGQGDTQQALLEVRSGAEPWHTIAGSQLEPDSATFGFRVPEWGAATESHFRVVYRLSGKSEPDVYEGVIRAEPADGSLVIASLSCHKTFTGDLKWNGLSIWLPHAELVAAVEAHEPDLLFFAGDQIYEGDLVGTDTRTDEIAMLDYLYKWYRWCWSFEDLTRTHPTVAIPDDHDVFHGNLWGAGGRRAVPHDGMTAQDAGGYKLSGRVVNCVHRTQTSHLPDPVDPAPIEQDISVYFTDLTWGGASLAIIADRMFKDSASPLVPEGKVVNGWFQNPDFDPVNADVPGAVLLGDRQEQFLNAWARDWSDGVWMKGVLSQTIFANVATLPDTATSDAVVPGLAVEPEEVYAEHDDRVADTDSNGWPQAGRNRAIRQMRRAFAFHLAGDQHLGSMIHYGVDAWRDSGVALCSPAIANTWPRRWFPPASARHGITDPADPNYTGDFVDGFGNLVTVYAVANPRQTGIEPARLYDRAPGYSIVRLDRATRTITMECWPRWVDPRSPDAQQFAGWPRTFQQADMFTPGDKHLDTIVVDGLERPVVQVEDERTGEVVYTIRLESRRFEPRVGGDGPYTVRVGDPDEGVWKVIQGLRPVASPQEWRVSF